MSQLAGLSLGVVLCLAAVTVHAQEPVEIGFITTLSTPVGYIGEEERDGFALAVRQEDGRLGGVPVRLLVEDDGLKPGSGKQSVEKMLQNGVRLFTGVNFSNVMIAVAPAVLKAGGFYVSLNAGPSNFAGAGCDKNLFAVAYQNDTHSETAAMAANEIGIKKVVLVAPAYQAGRDALNGFKRKFEGKVLAEIYTKLDQSDYSVELARIRSLNPDGVFQFLPGGAGINFGKQFANSGLKKSMKMVATRALDDGMLAALGDAAEGFYLSTLWTSERDNAANKAFVADFEKAFKRRPSAYAATSYDTARLIASALKAVNGDIKGQPGRFRAALRKADFQSVRGSFRFGPNQHPIQDWSLARIERNEDGRLDFKIIKALATDYGDAYSSQCKMD